MRTSETAQRLGISRHSLSYWRRIGLLSAAGRELSFADLVKARFISNCRQQGLSLQNIRQTLLRLRPRLGEVNEGAAALQGAVQGAVPAGDAIAKEPQEPHKALGKASERAVAIFSEDWHCRVVLYQFPYLLERDGEQLYDAATGQQFLPYESGLSRQGNLLSFRRQGEGDALQMTKRDKRVALLEDLFEKLSSSGDLKGAEGALRKIIGQMPDHTAALVELGNIAFARGDYADALRHYEEALEHRPDCSEAHYNIANIHFRERRYAAAIRIYCQCLDLEPQFAMAYYNLGLLFFKLQDYPAAVEALAAYCELEPDSSWSEQATKFIEKARACMEGG